MIKHSNLNPSSGCDTVEWTVASYIRGGGVQIQSSGTFTERLFTVGCCL